MSRAIPIVAAISIVLSSGIIHGLWINRWRVSREIELAVSKLDRVPMVIGDWRGRPQTVDRREWTRAGLDGLVMRHYENSRTGRTTGLVLVCGRPGPVSVHTPEICYPGAGFEMANAQPVKFSVNPDGRGAEFLKADFERQESFPPERLRVYWSWNATGTWSVPANPRLAFASRPLLYKLYLISRTSEGLERVRGHHPDGIPSTAVARIGKNAISRGVSSDPAGTGLLPTSGFSVAALCT